MSATLIAKELSAGHGDQLLFSGLDLVVAPGDVIGLVGANGAGKSTLLRILAGVEPPEQGDMQRHPPTAAVGYLPQEHERRSGETVRPSWSGVRVSRPRSATWTALPSSWAGTPGADDVYARALEQWLNPGTVLVSHDRSS